MAYIDIKKLIGFPSMAGNDGKFLQLSGGSLVFANASGGTGGTITQPANQVVYGTGSGVSSSNLLTWDGSTFVVTGNLNVAKSAGDAQGNILANSTAGGAILTLQVGNATTSSKYTYILLRSYDTTEHKWAFGHYGNNDFTFKDVTQATSPMIISGSNGAVTLSTLAGTGTRMVVADASGVLSTQSIPSGGGTGITDGDKGDVTVSASGATWTIDTGAVTLAKMATLAANSIIGNNTGASATPIALTAAQTKTLLALNNVENTALSTWAGSANITTLGTVATGTWNATAIGVTKGGTGLTAMGTGLQLLRTNAGATALEWFTPTYLTANQSITLSGDVAGSGTTAITTTIGANKVTLGMMAQVATATFLGRTTAATGNVEALTVAQAKTLLNLTGTNSGDQTITLTGNVTGSGTGSFATTIANNVVTNAMLSQVATATFKGRTTASTGNVEDLTATQATALLNTFTTSAKGLVPSPGTSSGLFLKDDGTWAAPAGGGGTSGSTSPVASFVVGDAGAPMAANATTYTNAAFNGLTASQLFVLVDGTKVMPGRTDRFSYTLAGTTVTFTNGLAALTEVEFYLSSPSGGGSVSQAQLDAKENVEFGNKTSHGFAVGYAVYKDSAGVWQRSNASASGINTRIDGIVVSVADANNFTLGRNGTKFSTSGLSLTSGTTYYLATTTSGINYTSTEPSTIAQVSKRVFETNTANEATINISEGYEITAAASTGGDVVKLTTGSWSAVATTTISFSTYISSYNRIVILFKSIYGTSDAADLQCRTSSDGSTFDSGSFDYVWGRTARAGSSTGSSAQINLLGNVGTTGTNEAHYIELTIIDPNQSTLRGRLNWIGGYKTGSSEFGNYSAVNGYACRGVAAQIKAIQLFPSTGTFSGSYEIWGYK